MIKNEVRKGSLDLYFDGLFKVIIRKGPNVKISSPRAPDGKWVHLNRCKQWKNIELILPYRDRPPGTGETLQPDRDITEADANIHEQDDPMTVESQPDATQ